MQQRHVQKEQAFAERAAAFFNTVSNKTSLITITRAALNERGTHVTIFFTVLPETQESAAIDFMQRQLHNLKAYLRQHMRNRIPHVTLELDVGDKHRRHLDELSGGTHQ